MWIKRENEPNLTIKDFTEGDLINYWVKENQYVGEVVRVEGTIHVHFLQSNGKIWNYNEELTHHIHPNQVFRHVSRKGQRLSGTLVRSMWKQMGYAVGVHDFCLLQDFNTVSLDIPEDESESEDESSDEMDDFIVPDEEGESFCHPDMTKLTEEQQKWVLETHQAVNEWEQWTPQDSQQKAIKSFVDSMALKYGKQEDERRFGKGEASLEYQKPPTKLN